MDAGEWSYRCTRCSEWKRNADFPRRKDSPWGIERQCLVCLRARIKARRAAKRELILSQRRRSYVARKERMKLASLEVSSCPHFVDRDLVMPFVERLVRLNTWETFDAQGAARAANTSARTISAIRGGEREQVRWTVAENIAIAVDRLDEFMALFPEPGLDGWSKAGHRYCCRCRRYDVIHWAQGLCHTCYTGFKKGRWQPEDIDTIPELRKRPSGWNARRDYRAAKKLALV